MRARIVRPPRAVGEPSSNTKPVQQQDDTSLPFMPPALGDAAPAIGIGATVAFGGLVFAELGHIPEAGETFEIQGHRVTVTEAERTRVNKVRIEKLVEQAEATNGE